MNSSPGQSRKSAWDLYWASGTLHSCTSSYRDNYAGAIGSFWKARFETLADGQAMLDLATGNGALPQLLARGVSGDRDIRVQAVDLATIAPGWHSPAAYPNISFRSGISIESLPFEDASFDLVVSQYGIEYAQWPQALVEAMRVCRPQGSAAFVLHHSDSVLVSVGQEELAGHALLLAPDGLLAAAEQVLPWVAKARAQEVMDQGQATLARQRYNRAIAAVGTAIERSRAPDALIEARDRIHALLSSMATGDVVLRIAQVRDYRSALEAASLRTAEMIGHALDQNGVAALEQVLCELRPHAVIKVSELKQEQGVLGWAVVIHPA